MGRISIKYRADRVSQALMVAFIQLLTPQGGLSSEILVDRLVAEVNGDPITHQDVRGKIESGNLVEVGAFPAKEGDAPYFIALQDLINKKLVEQKVEEAGIEVTDDEVEAEIDGFLGKKGLDRKGLLNALAQEGMDYKRYFDDFKNRMLIRKFQGRFIIPSVKISDKDLELFYFRMQGSSPEGIRLRLRQIFISLDEGAPDSIKKARQEVVGSVLQKLEQGMEFAEVAKIYSSSPGASENGGLMPDVSLKDLAPKFRSVIEELEKGAFSSPVEIGSGIYIFYLEDKFLSDTSDFESKKGELELRLRQRQMERETLRWIESQRNLSKIRIIHRDYEKGFE